MPVSHTYVGSTNVTSTNSRALGTDATPAVDDVYIVMVAWYDAGGSVDISSVTNTGFTVDSWVINQQTAIGSNNVRMAYAKAKVTGSGTGQPTVNWASPVDTVRFTGHYLTGADDDDANWDVKVQESATAITTLTGNFDSSDADSWQLLVCGASPTAANSTEATGWTEHFQILGQSLPGNNQSVDGSNGTAFGSTWSTSTGGSGAQMLAIQVPEPGGGGSPSTILPLLNAYYG